MKYGADVLVLVGIRDFSSPLCPELDIADLLGQQASISPFPSVQQEDEVFPGWRVARRFSGIHDRQAMLQLLRSQSPLSCKGIILCDRSASSQSTSCMNMSAASFKRLVIYSPTYLWMTKLTTLEAWEKEGDWEDECGEGTEGEIDIAKQRERCLFELMLIFLQYNSKQKHSRTRRREKGKWKKLRRLRKMGVGEEVISGEVSLEKGSIEDDEMVDREEAEEGREKRNEEEERFLQLNPRYKEDYITTRAAFRRTCMAVDQRYHELNQRFPSFQQWAQYASRLAFFEGLCSCIPPPPRQGV